MRFFNQACPRVPRSLSKRLDFDGLTCSPTSASTFKSLKPVREPRASQQPSASGSIQAQDFAAPPEPPAVARYVDDVAWGEPGDQSPRVDGHPGDVYANIQPPEPPVVTLPRSPILREFDEVRREVLRQEAEHRLLDLPPNPPMVINPDWGPPPAQPPLRYLRNERTEWGGEASALHHAPPTGLRRDFYQLVEQRMVLIRSHVQARVRLFIPGQTRLPVPLEQTALTGRRRTLVTTPTARYHLDDNFREVPNQRTLPSQWRGRTEFEIDARTYRQLRHVYQALR